MRSFALVMSALALVACGEVSTPEVEAPPAPPPAAAPVAEIWDAPNSALEAVEPTIFGITGSTTVWDAMAPVGRAYEGGEGAPTLTVYIRTVGSDQVVDVLRDGLADDSIGREHIRVEFRREPDGWYPTNAYRRQTCRRAADPEQWSSAPCP